MTARPRFFKNFPLSSRWIATGSAAVILIVAWLVWRGWGNGPATMTVSAREFLRQISVSGRVIPAEAADLAFKTGGRVAAIKAAVGDTVPAGAILLVLENSDEIEEKREAELDLAEARLELDQLLTPVENKVEEEELKKAYEEGLSEAAVVYDELYQALDDLENIFFAKDLSLTGEDNLEYYASVAGLFDPGLRQAPAVVTAAYRQAETSFAPAVRAYQAATRGRSGPAEEKAIVVTTDLVAAVLNAIKGGLDLVQSFQDASLAYNFTPRDPSLVSSHLADLKELRELVNNHWLVLVEATKVVRSQQSVLQTDDLAIRAQKLQVEKKEVVLRQVADRLADTYLRAPFAGVVTRLDIELGEMAAANDVVVALISAGVLEVESFVPEINITLIKVGDRAELTLDAYGEEVKFPAEVTMIDPAETIRDGVATYKMILRFLEDDPRIKPGMTANVVVTTERRENVLSVPLGTVLDRDGRKAVLVKENKAVSERTVMTGGVSSFGEVEIVSGLTAGETIYLDPAAVLAN